MRIRSGKDMGYGIWNMGYWLEIKMKIRIIFSMRRRTKMDHQLRTNLILILPLHPAAGRSR